MTWVPGNRGKSRCCGLRGHGDTRHRPRSLPGRRTLVRPRHHRLRPTSANQPPRRTPLLAGAAGNTDEQLLPVCGRKPTATARRMKGRTSLAAVSQDADPRLSARLLLPPWPAPAADLTATPAVPAPGIRFTSNSRTRPVRPRREPRRTARSAHRPGHHPSVRIGASAGVGSSRSERAAAEGQYAASGAEQQRQNRQEIHFELSFSWPPPGLSEADPTRFQALRHLAGRPLGCSVSTHCDR